MCNYYLAVDIGASSGRHIIGWVQDHVMKVREIYRFSNGMEMVDGTLCWNLVGLFEEIKAGMRECKKLGINPESMGIDTWAVDFVLLDKQGHVLGKTAGYRDRRTEGMDLKVYERISREELYRRTGIQKQIFNTVYQLMAVKEKQPDILSQAESFLMIPDYLNFLLTGVQKQEYTNATTTQLVNPSERTWDRELIEALGYPQKLFGGLSMPGTVVGTLTKAVQDEVGFNCKVVLPATHDTGSAVMAVPVPENGERKGHETEKTHDTDGGLLYISSGTWSLMGTELSEADCSAESRKANLTNEGGYEYRFRYLKNIMGLWMIQSVKKELAAAGEAYSFAELCRMASHETIKSIVPCNDDVFLAPESMTEAVKAYLREAGQEVPETAGALAAVIYNSLAQCYKETVEELEAITGRTYQAVNIVGGGSNAEYLNQLTAKATGKTVYAGPGEATAIGNLLAQMIRAGEFQGLTEARAAVYHSFEISTYE